MRDASVSYLGALIHLGSDFKIENVKFYLGRKMADVARPATFGFPGLSPLSYSAPANGTSSTHSNVGIFAEALCT